MGALILVKVANGNSVQFGMIFGVGNFFFLLG